jgi:hypothetical protein
MERLESWIWIAWLVIWCPTSCMWSIHFTHAPSLVTRANALTTRTWRCVLGKQDNGISLRGRPRHSPCQQDSGFGCCDSKTARKPHGQRYPESIPFSHDKPARLSNGPYQYNYFSSYTTAQLFHRFTVKVTCHVRQLGQLKGHVCKYRDFSPFFFSCLLDVLLQRQLGSTNWIWNDMKKEEASLFGLVYVSPKESTVQKYHVSCHLIWFSSWLSPSIRPSALLLLMTKSCSLV